MRKIFHLYSKNIFKHFGEIFKDFLLAINCRTSLFNDENMRILISTALTASLLRRRDASLCVPCVESQLPVPHSCSAVTQGRDNW